MKNLAINVPILHDATSFYRAANPLANLRERCKYLNCVSPQSWSDASTRLVDGCFFQRPYITEHKDAMMMAKESGRKIWVDYDDYLLEVATDNPTFDRYSKEEVQANVKSILENADIVTVSTPELKKLYDQFNKNIKVVPNAADMDLLCYKTRGTPVPRKKILAWRGSKTHHRDVFSYAASIMTASRDEKHKDWQWHFIGDNLWFLTDSMPHFQTYITKGMGPLEYHRHIQQLGAAAFQVPLHDSKFNRAKSNIAWIEATFAGSIAIGPSWEEWEKPGIITYKNEAEYLQALYAIAGGHINIEKTCAKSWEFIQDNLTLAKVNEVRLDVLCELFECDRKDLGAD